MTDKRTFDAAKRASMTDFFNDPEFIIDDTVSTSSKNLSDLRLDRIKKLAGQVQASLIEGFDKSGGGSAKLEKLNAAFDARIENLDYANLESIKETLSGTFLGLMIILGLSQKVHGSDYWSKQKGWDDFDNWLADMNKNIYSLDEEVRQLINSKVKA